MLLENWVDPISQALARGAGAHGPLMLMYHAVTPGAGTPPWTWAVTAARLEAQLDYLVSEGWRAGTMSSLLDPGQLPAKTVVLTFDDGYADNLVAVEMLARRGMCATWFIVSDSVGQPPKWPADGRPEGRLLSAQELRDMRVAGMEIGSHTRSHCPLTETAPELWEDELRGAREDLENLLGAAVTSFAYPYGKFNDATVEAVRRAGYRAACTTRSGWALRDRDPLRMRRVSVFNHDDRAAFARKLAFADNDVSWPRLGGYALDRVKSRLGIATP